MDGTESRSGVPRDDLNVRDVGEEEHNAPTLNAPFVAGPDLPAPGAPMSPSGSQRSDCECPHCSATQRALDIAIP